MSSGALCEVCGNEIDSVAVRCPFCGTARAGAFPKAGLEHRVINLEKGRPLVHEAVQRMLQEIDAARRHGCGIMILIHGYGSSGKGGAIRREVRRRLDLMRHQHEINDVLLGEEIGNRSGHCRQLQRRFPFMAPYLKRSNPGVTFIVF